VAWLLVYLQQERASRNAYRSDSGAADPDIPIDFHLWVKSLNLIPYTTPNSAVSAYEEALNLASQIRSSPFPLVKLVSFVALYRTAKTESKQTLTHRRTA
jgi:hypothetical protein